MMPELSGMVQVAQETILLTLGGISAAGSVALVAVVACLIVQARPMARVRR